MAGPILLPGNEPTVEGQLFCPAVAGAANWASTAYQSREQACSICSRRNPATFTRKNDQWWEAGKSFYGGGTRRAPGRCQGGKFLKAIDIQTGKTAWEIPDIGGGILASGLMATAGGLVFYGDGNGAFIAAGREERKAALALQHRPELEGRAHDIHGGRHTVRRYRRRLHDPFVQPAVKRILKLYGLLRM